MKNIDEAKILKAMRHKKPAALEAVIDRYTPFVSTVVFNIIGEYMDLMDVEEVTAETFLALWNSAERVQEGKIKPYLAAIARNKAKNKLRDEYRPALSIEDDYIELAGADVEEKLTQAEKRDIIHAALDSMPPQDREIFIRYYFHCQTAARISKEMGINPSTVQSRLHRGRDKLKKILIEGGYDEA